jgi:hypothetical protein
MGFVGLVLADAGEYTPVLAFGVGALLLVGFIALLVPALAAPSATPRSAHVVAALGVVFIASVCLWNGANHSEHVLINRDAGAYVDAGRWIARNGTLEVRAKAGPFRGQNAPQFPDIGMGRARKVPLELQFHASHLLPALLAEAYALGGDQGMFALPAWLGAIALLEFFVLAWRLFRHPFFALVAVAALAVMLPEVSFARDAYTEIPTQIFVFGALALLVDKRLLPHWRVALGADDLHSIERLRVAGSLAYDHLSPFVPHLVDVAIEEQ